MHRIVLTWRVSLHLIFITIYGVVCVQLAHFSIGDWKDISIAHVIIIIKSEVSTFPIVSIFFGGFVSEMFVTSYSVTYCIYIPWKPGKCMRPSVYCLYFTLFHVTAVVVWFDQIWAARAMHMIQREISVSLHSEFVQNGPLEVSVRVTVIYISSVAKLVSRRKK